MKIKISFNSYEVEANLLDTPTGRAIYDILPIESTVNTWGDEIYFGISIDVDLEAQAKAETEIGDLALWPPMPAFCIFFGPTPASIDDTPTAASPVNIFGKLDPVDVDNLRSIQDGENVIIEKMG